MKIRELADTAQKCIECSCIRQAARSTTLSEIGSISQKAISVENWGCDDVDKLLRESFDTYKKLYTSAVPPSEKDPWWALRSKNHRPGTVDPFGQKATDSYKELYDLLKDRRESERNASKSTKQSRRDRKSSRHRSRGDGDDSRE